MNCEEVRALIEALHDGEVGPRGSDQVQAHVSTCAPCRAASERLTALSAVLKRSTVPAPSPELDERVARAFRRQHARTPPAAPRWWARLFAGSVSIPKPAFAAAVVAVAAALAGATMIGRITSRPGSEAAGLPAHQPAAHAAAPPRLVEVTKIVEVPVVREKVVTRTVIVSRGRDRVGKVRRQEPAPARNERELAMSGSVSPNGYFTVANLSDFQPAKEMKARVIKEAESREK